MTGKLLHVLFGGVGRRGLAGAAAQPEGPDETLDGAGAGGLVLEAGGPESAGVDPAAPGEEIFQFGRKVKQSRQGPDLERAEGGERQQPRSANGRDFAPGES